MNNVDQIELIKLRLRQACVELERRVRAGDDYSVEALLQADEQLAADEDAALELIYTEYVLREERGESVSHEEWFQRFPRWRTRLERLFNLHTEMKKTEANASTLSFENRGEGETQQPPFGPGGYDILKELGRGGMGVVYLARQRRLERLVALKMLIAGEFAGPGDWQRMLAEARAAARLRHAHIVQIIEVGEWPADGSRREVPFIAMEYVTGGNLADRLRHGPMPAREAAALLATVALAIDHAHQNGIIHRDLKPANVLLANPPDQDSSADRHATNFPPLREPKITDFGLAKVMDSPEGMSRSHAIVGTPSYMAPEQIGGGNRVGPAADVYALGAMLYECLTGIPPFRGKTALDTLEQVRSREPTPPRQLQPRAPRDLETICLTCLQKEPWRRYAHASELADDLHRFLAGEPIRARRISILHRLVKWVRRRPTLATLLVSSAFLIVTSFVAVTWLWQKTRIALGDVQAARWSEQEQARRNQTQLYETLLAIAERDWINLDRAAARRWLNECPPPLRDQRWQKLSRQVNAERDCSIATELPAVLALSPNGQQLVTAIGISPAVLAVMDAESGARICQSPPLWSAGESGLIHWHDERVIVACRTNSRLIDGMAVGKERNRPPASMRILSWTPGKGQADVFVRLQDPPGGRLIAGIGPWAGQIEGDRLRLWNVDNTEMMSLTAVPPRTLDWMRWSADGGFVAAGNAETGAVIVWELASGRVRTETVVQWGLTAMTGFELGRNGASLLVADRVEKSDRGTLRMVDLSTGNERWRKTLLVDELGCLAFAPDGRMLATGGRDRVIRIRDAFTGEERLQLRGHTTTVMKIVFAADGRRLASTGLDRIARVWDLGD